MLSLEILPLDEVAVGDVQGGPSKGVSVEIFGLDGLHITCISRYLSYILLLLQRLKLIIDLLRNVP